MGPQTVREVDLYIIYIGSMANGIFTYILLIYMVTVGKYTVHGSLGNIFIHTLLQAG